MNDDRQKELDGLADGLVSRGVPNNLAKKTVELIYQMGRLDEKMFWTEQQKKALENRQ